MNDAIDLSAVKPLLSGVARPRACCSCEFSATEGKDRVCRFEPPKMAFIPVPVQQTVPGPNGLQRVQGMQMTVHSGFPVVQDTQWCGKFMARGAH
jgi:hypothetical protein